MIAAVFAAEKWFIDFFIKMVKFDCKITGGWRSGDTSAMRKSSELVLTKMTLQNLSPRLINTSLLDVFCTRLGGRIEKVKFSVKQKRLKIKFSCPPLAERPPAILASFAAFALLQRLLLLLVVRARAVIWLAEIWTAGRASAWIASIARIFRLITITGAFINALTFDNIIIIS